MCALADLCLVVCDPAKIEELWQHVEPVLAPAFGDKTAPDSTIESTLEALRRGAALLWVVWSEDRRKILAAATTEIWNLASRKVCVVTSCAGQSVEEWSHYLRDMERYAREEGCDVIRIYGRKGWKKFFPDYIEPWTTIQKAL